MPRTSRLAPQRVTERGNDLIGTPVPSSGWMRARIRQDDGRTRLGDGDVRQ